MSATPCEAVTRYHHIQPTRRGDYLIKWIGIREVGRVATRDEAIATAERLENEMRARSEAAEEFNRQRDAFVESHPDFRTRTIQWQKNRNCLFEDACRASRNAYALRRMLVGVNPCTPSVASGYAESRAERAERIAEELWADYNNAVQIDIDIKQAIYRLDAAAWERALTSAGVWRA